ncbi:FKBP-type peptidyl-prolyl cis-trans isomerase [Medicago truncatula]|uniref:peptidylprolyl isomerase n=1 Tax=Medicago truncatula TaxID=3880 RepID=G7LDI1_MEDTR|nr:FKBP-type peptidyl-prolyl cis-trans isomerase [Medicago truncatula]
MGKGEMKLQLGGRRRLRFCLLTIPPQYAFGSSESRQELAVVPPNSTLCYEVELASFVKEKDFEDMNNEEKIEAVRKKHKQGLALLAAGEDVRASKRFMKEFKIVKILRSNFTRDFDKCKTVWEGFEHAANWFKIQELKEGTNVWNRYTY